MLWTLNGLCLLFGLGVVVGASAAFFVDSPMDGNWRQAMFGPAVAAALGALYLVMQWMGPVGGGG